MYNVGCGVECNYVEAVVHDVEWVVKKGFGGGREGGREGWMDGYVNRYINKQINKQTNLQLYFFCIP